jgi:ABC-type lipoprotein export system ATPase subunit
VTTASEPLVAVHKVVKNYQSLRPLRIDSLTVAAGDVVSITGLDAPGAETLVGLLTGAIVPDSGEVRLFGRSTTDVTDSDAWLAMLDAVGIVTDRAVLIGQFTVEQNIAMPFTLAVDPIAAELRPQVEALAREIDLDDQDLKQRIGESSPLVQARVRLARALALNPTLVLAEHPSASLPRDHVVPFATSLNHIARGRGMAVLAITADDAFAVALGGVVLRHEAATGALRPRRTWSKLFNRS